MRRYSHADAAVGVASGGLDLAAAAGLPVLRVGEFQRDGFQVGSQEEGWIEGKWGASYNAFLAGNLNIGLGYHNGALADFDEGLLRHSLSEFLNLVREGVDQRFQGTHLLLPEGVRFDRAGLDDFAGAYRTCGPSGIK